MTAFNASEQFAASKAHVESLLALSSRAVARAERLSALNLNTARSVFEDGVASSLTLMDARKPADLADLQAALAKPTVEKAVAYSRSVSEIVAEGQQEVAKLFEAQVAEVNKTVTSELNKSFATALENIAKCAPAGFEAVFAAAKSAMETANRVYENASKATTQLAEVAIANVVTGTEAASSVVTSKVSK